VNFDDGCIGQKELDVGERGPLCAQNPLATVWSFEGKTNCKYFAIGSQAAPLLANPWRRMIVAVCFPGAGRVVFSRGGACTHGAWPLNDLEWSIVT
jgi:hypothetical protein